MPEIDPSQPAETLDLDLIRDKIRESFYFFAKGVLKFSWLTPHIHLDVCNDLSNPDLLRKVFVLPRGWLKTTICSIAYPIWRATRNPNLRFLIAQNNQVNARAKLRVIRDLFERNELLRTLYPDLLPGPGSTWSADSLCLTRSESFPESTFECVGVRGQATSRHYNCIIEDDTVAPDFDELGNEMLAPTHDDIRKAIGWHQLALPLLTNAETDERVVVGTRWYEEDLISYIIDHEPNYHVVTRSCLENDEGESDPKGHVTYPERFSTKVLDEYETSLGPYFFSTLMLNLPVRTGDMIFQSHWFKEYDELPPSQSLIKWTTVDPATDPELSTSKRETDYNVVMTCGKDLITGYIYVLDYFRQRCNPGELAAAIFSHVMKWNPIEVGYEDVAYQRSMDYWLRELMRQHERVFVLKPVKRTGRKSKELHIMGLQPIAAAGMIHIRPWMRELLSEFLSFPRGTNDDLIDAMAMQTGMWRRTASKSEKRLKPDPSNPFDLTAVLTELKLKAHVDDSLIFDPLQSESSREEMIHYG